MKINYKVLSILNILLFTVCLIIYLLPYFIDSDINRILLSKLSFNIFYPCLLGCLILSMFNVIKKKDRNVFITFDYLILFCIVFFFSKFVYIVFFKDV